MQDLHNLTEADTRALLIDPKLAAAGWGVVEGSRIRREVITLGRLTGGGKRARGESADYVLMYKGQKLAVLEAKRAALPDTEGVAQAKRYAHLLQARFAFSSNGLGIYQIDMQTGAEGYIPAFPTPDELWNATFAVQNQWRQRFAAIPFEDKSGTYQARYYQHNAINKTLEALIAGQSRILLTLATGTGKTFIAFQIAWKLFHSRWNLKDWQQENEPTRRPRILFLADRNILANQAFNDFSAFPEDALVRISPDAIRKKGMVPKNGNIFFTIFQTFMTGQNPDGTPAPAFGDYPPDFFDLIIIDECHRGGANDESSWREILNYFAPAVHLGLTATPKRAGNVDTYKYFGEPVYVYSLKEGVNDGFLTPFKVVQIATTLDEYVYTPDDDVLEGEVEEGKLYTEKDFNRIIEIPERERHRVRLFMEKIDQNQKTLVFCATQNHALMIRDAINQLKQNKHPDYCVRVTANDGAEGEKWLSIFRDNEKSIPTVLTTSQKLSTGVDARNVRNIVLLRPINSMIEFKQIVGRGTRLFEGKDYFTIYDFVEACKLFSDPEWDGEPVDPVIPGPCDPPAPCPVCGKRPCVCIKDPPPPCPVCGKQPCVCNKRSKIKIRLADGKERAIQHMAATSFWSPDGKPISAMQFIEGLYGQLPTFFRSEEELRSIWSNPDTRKRLLQGLEDKGFGGSQLAEASIIIDAEDSDIFDVLAYIAFALAPQSRKERVSTRKDDIFAHYGNKEQQFLDFVLSHYVAEGVSELDTEKLPALLELKYHSLQDATTELGSVGAIRDVFVGFQQGLYM